jgi:hypothetical protein
MACCFLYGISRKWITWYPQHFYTSALQRLASSLFPLTAILQKRSKYVRLYILLFFVFFLLKGTEKDTRNAESMTIR